MGTAGKLVSNKQKNASLPFDSPVERDAVAEAGLQVAVDAVVADVGFCGWRGEGTGKKKEGEAVGWGKKNETRVGLSSRRVGPGPALRVGHAPPPPPPLSSPHHHTLTAANEPLVEDGALADVKVGAGGKKEGGGGWLDQPTKKNAEVARR